MNLYNIDLVLIASVNNLAISKTVTYGATKLGEVIKPNPLTMDLLRCKQLGNIVVLQIPEAIHYRLIDGCVITSSPTAVKRDSKHVLHKALLQAITVIVKCHSHGSNKVLTQQLLVMW